MNPKLVVLALLALALSIGSLFASRHFLKQNQERAQAAQTGQSGQPKH
jgi:hypothetical protein